MAAPTLIGRYEIVALLGSGAMGSVFKARDPVVGRTVALKTIHSAALSGENAEEFRARFNREARASGVLAHPAIVPVFDVGEHEGAPFLVMEFVEGRTLADAIKMGERFTLDRVCEIGQQLADALGYAHRQGVIHRDIKPANILLTSREVYGSERPRITDFGIAKIAASDITTTGQLLGTPSFMPPEQFTGATIDGRADLFSLGVILYALATGEQPFFGETVTAVSYKVVHTDPIPPSKLNPAISPGLEAVILKCLAKNPAARYQTGEELAQDLAALRANPDATLAAGNLHLPVPGNAFARKPAGPAKTPSKQTRIEVISAVSLLAVAAAVACAWFLPRLYHPKPAPPPQQAVTAPQPVTPSVNPIPAPVSTVQEPNPPAPKPEAAAKPTPSKRSAASAKTTPPSVTQPAPTAPAANPAPPPAAKPAKSTPPPAPAPAAPAPAADPHKLDPNTNSKFKIELSHLPNGLPITVQMNKSPYLDFVTGDKTDLNNLFVPPGIQTFRVTVMNGTQKIASNIVSSEFKAKKRKNLKIELRNQGKVPAGSPSPLGPTAQIFISLSTPLF